ncbi:MAG: MFS transporter [Pirellulales bacterium]|nr:MFS transporter [Pirellulales bacterium]
MSEAPSGSTAVNSPPPKHRFGRTFWILNSIEMFERLAYNTFRVVAPLYIMQADDVGGLHLTAWDKGVIYACWAVFQSLLPVFTGGLADRFGYKRTLVCAISAMMSGYLVMGLVRGVPGISNYLSFVIGLMLMATGTAFFKPGLWGSLAHQMTEETASLGWGIFYWVVNIGSFIGPFASSILLNTSKYLPGIFYGAPHSPEAWRNLFLACAFFTFLNLLLLLTFRDVPSGASKTESLFHVLKRTVVNVVEPRLLCWLAIMSCFWLMMYQLWDLQPNFIADWVDSGGMARSLQWLPEGLRKVFVEETARGPQVPQQLLVSFNSLFILLGVVGMSWLTRHMRTLSSMLLGMIVATTGVLLAGWTQSAWVLVSGILFFSLGEMMVGPKINQYLTLIAPPGKKGLYLGYANVPAGLGIFFGSQIAGFVYGRYGEKATLALRYLAEKTSWGLAKHWNGDFSTLERTLGIKRPQAMDKLQEITGMDPHAATRLLWDAYSPHYVWIPFALIGVAAALALWFFGQRAKRWSDMNA